MYTAYRAYRAVPVGINYCHTRQTSSDIATNCHGGTAVAGEHDQHIITNFQLEMKTHRGVKVLEWRISNARECLLDDTEILFQKMMRPLELITCLLTNRLN